MATPRAESTRRRPRWTKRVRFSETLGLNEFGEAGVDLTAAGVFTLGECENFGKAYAV